MGLPPSSLGGLSPRLASPAHSGFGGRTPQLGAGTPRSDGGASPRLGGGAGGAGGGGNRQQRSTRDRKLVGATVKIVKGPMKGHVGIVKDATESIVKVELHTNCQTISVDRNRIETVATGTAAPSGGISSYARTPQYG